MVAISPQSPNRLSLASIQNSDAILPIPPRADLSSLLEFIIINSEDKEVIICTPPGRNLCQSDQNRVGERDCPKPMFKIPLSRTLTIVPISPTLKVSSKSEAKDSSNPPIGFLFILWDKQSGEVDTLPIKLPLLKREGMGLTNCSFEINPIENQGLEITLRRLGAKIVHEFYV